MNEFQFFTISHFIPLAVACAVFVSIFIFHKWLRRPRVNRAVKIGLAVILIICELSLQLSYVFSNTWSLHALPLQLCSLTLLIAAASLITNKKRLHVIVFYLGILGAVQALATPNVDFGFPHFRYFHFFIAHIAIIAAALIIVIDGYRPKPQSIFTAIFWLHVLAIPAAIVNLLSGETNFMFLARKPGTASLLDLLAPWPWYLLQLEAVAFVLCSTLFLMTYVWASIFDKRRKL